MCVRIRGFLAGLILLASACPISAAQIAALHSSRSISDVDWQNWEKANAYYEGRFGKAYSVGVINLSRSSQMFFVVFQVRNTSQLVLDAKCELKASSSGHTVYAIEQRLRPGDVSDPSGAGTMEASQDGEKFTARCEMNIPLL